MNTTMRADAIGYIVLFGAEHTFVTYQFSSGSLAWGIACGLFCIAVWLLFWNHLRREQHLPELSPVPAVPVDWRAPNVIYPDWNEVRRKAIRDITEAREAVTP